MTSTKINSGQVQLRVSGTCPAGQQMTGVNANGTVACAPPTFAAAALQCTDTAIVTTSIAAGANMFINNPGCPATYFAVVPYCFTYAAGVYSKGSGTNSNASGFATFCAWQNTTGAAQDVYGGAVCCRVPSQ